MSTTIEHYFTSGTVPRHAPSQMELMMSNASITPAPPANRAGNDFDLLWTLSRQECRALCSLSRMNGQYETRVSVDDQVLVSRRSARINDVLDVAELWRDRLSAMGWIPEADIVMLQRKPDRRRASL